eukprot:TRINITY_DN1720_c0_g1_i1.p1 TRINITY_DN1720_c0_g1~~TRINITY_DN1720_c0_g1_i1.p1  ORF type:complete len:186 (+),score=71.99 TRINITY_DN1720_c0_g1_i1:23-559(+)
MGASTSDLRPDEIEELCSLTPFSNKEIVRLFNRFKRLDRDNQGVISTDSLLEIPELAMNPLVTRIVNLFDSNQEEHINFKQFVTTLAPLSQYASLEDKMELAFRVYDVDGDGVIDQRDIKEILLMMVGNEISEKNLDLIAKATLVEADTKHDGLSIDLDDFEKVMRSANLEQKFTITL